LARLVVVSNRARVNLFVFAHCGAKVNIMNSKPAHAAPDTPRMFFADSRASTSQECLQKAAECLRLVQTSLASTNKAILLEMGEAWISRAEQQKAEMKGAPGHAAD
jgi:hypothetical protein